MLSLLACMLAGPDVAGSVGAYLRAHREGDEALVRGDLGDARRAFRRCLKVDADSSTSLYALACVESRAGRTEEALDWLVQAVAAGYEDADVAEWDDDLRSLRDDSRFRSLVLDMRANALKRGPGPNRIVAIGPKKRSYRPCSLAVDDQGRYAIVGDGTGALVLLDVHTGLVDRELPSLTEHVSALAFHPDGERLAALTQDARLHLIPLDGDGSRRCSFGPVVSVPAKDPESCCHGAFLRFDPTGERCLVAVRHLGASLWTVGGERLQAWETQDRFVTRIAWSPDGKTIAEPVGDVVRFRDGQTGEVLEHTLKPPTPPRYVALHPDGRRVATAHRDGIVCIWDLENPEPIWTREVRDMFEQPSVDFVSFSPDGERLAAASGPGPAELSVFDTDTGEVLLEQVYIGGRICGHAPASWSPDGQRIWFAFAGGSLHLHGFAVDRAQRSTGGWYNCQGELGPPGSLGDFGLGRAAPPQVSPAGTAAFLRHQGVVGLDTRTGNPLWHRPWIRPAQDVVQAPSGYFTAKTDEIEDLNLFIGSEDFRGTWLVPRAKKLFDPKRVRAARAGVVLVPPELD